MLWRNGRITVLMGGVANACGAAWPNARAMTDVTNSELIRMLRMWETGQAHSEK